MNYQQALQELERSGNRRSLPDVTHVGRFIERDGRQMLNLSSNDYLGLATRPALQEAFLASEAARQWPLSSSSSRLLTGNFSVYTDFECRIAADFGRESALLFNSGYHANNGILPALADKRTLILADKLVHASLIDGIRLSDAPFLRYRHNDYTQLERIVAKQASQYETIILVTESIFSMDGDVTDLPRLVDLKRHYPQLMLYVDEAHAIGVRGERGLGVAEECGCIGEIDLLVGTFGKALASMGAYVVCSEVIRSYLINKMRPLIFSTALPPLQMAWTQFLWEQLPTWQSERERLHRMSRQLAQALQGRGGEISESHIIPFLIGDSRDCIVQAEQLQRKGFYCLPVRPPTVPQGTSRIRFSLTAAIQPAEVERLIQAIQEEVR